MFSLDNGTERRLLVRSRAFDDKELGMIDKADTLRQMHHDIARDPDAFWLNQARRLDWESFPTRANIWIPVATTPPSFSKGTSRARGEPSLTANCIRKSVVSPMC